MCKTNDDDDDDDDDGNDIDGDCDEWNSVTGVCCLSAQSEHACIAGMSLLMLTHSCSQLLCIQKQRSRISHALCTGFRHLGTYPKNPVGFLGYTHLKNPLQKNPHFYFNLILVCTLYATNNAIFYCFKASKALSY